MRDINIQVHENHTVDFENGYAGLNLENLQGNITFNFDNFVDGIARVETVINNQDGYINIDKVGQTYTLPIKSSLLTGDSILMQLVIQQETKYVKYTGDYDPNQTYYIKQGESYIAFIPSRVVGEVLYTAETPIWKSEVFFLKVGTSINATTTIPEDYPSWVETLNNLIEETENAIDRAGRLDIEGEQTDDGAIITITNQDGDKTSVEILNGEKGEQGEKGEPGAIKMIIVAELPATGADDTIYLVPITPDTSGNNYAEYVYINGAWELLGKIGVQVDLTNYVQFTDLPTAAKSGPIRIGNAYGTAVNSVGTLYPTKVEFSNYPSMSDFAFIGKGTLENVISGSVMSSGNTAPTTSTKGRLGQLYINTTDNSVYQLVAISGNTYTWVQNTTKSYVDGLVGDIGTALDEISGEVI